MLRLWREYRGSENENFDQKDRERFDSPAVFDDQIETLGE